jgi:hypothetical protein
MNPETNFQPVDQSTPATFPVQCTHHAACEKDAKHSKYHFRIQKIKRKDIFKNQQVATKQNNETIKSQMHYLISIQFEIDLHFSFLDSHKIPFTQGHRKK